MSRPSDAAPVTVWVVILVATAAACNGDGRAQGEVLDTGAGYVLVGAEGDGDNVAGFGYFGQVELVGTCLGIHGTTVIWPHGTEVVSEDPLTINVPEVGRVTVGDHIEGGGAEWAADHLPDGIDGVPSGCPSDDLVAFFAE